MVSTLGNVNGFVKSSAWLGNKHFEFDGTTKSLVRSAIVNGANANAMVQANFAGLTKSGARDYKIIAAPHDSRANGFGPTKLGLSKCNMITNIAQI